MRIRLGINKTNAANTYRELSVQYSMRTIGVLYCRIGTGRYITPMVLFLCCAFCVLVQSNVSGLLLIIMLCWIVLNFMFCIGILDWVAVLQCALEYIGLLHCNELHRIAFCVLNWNIGLDSGCKLISSSPPLCGKIPERSGHHLITARVTAPNLWGDLERLKLLGIPRSHVCRESLSTTVSRHSVWVDPWGPGSENLNQGGFERKGA